MSVVFVSLIGREETVVFLAKLFSFAVHQGVKRGFFRCIFLVWWRGVLRCRCYAKE